MNHNLDPRNATVALSRLKPKILAFNPSNLVDIDDVGVILHEINGYWEFS